MTSKDNNPFIADFQFFKSRFQKIHKETKLSSRSYADNVGKLAKLLSSKQTSKNTFENDLESSNNSSKNVGLQQKLLAKEMIAQT